MNKTWQNIAAGIAILVVLVPFGCSDAAGPQTQRLDSTLESTLSVVSQDVAQLSVAGVTAGAPKGVFSIGWKKFVGPNITEAGTIGEAYAVVQLDTSAATVRPSGIDIGTVTLAYQGGTAELTKHVTPDGRVMYETFSRGMFSIAAVPVNIPFVANGVYAFDVSGSSAFSAGKFQITAPQSLLSITGHANGDTVSNNTDLVLQWTGGSVSDSVLVRIVPHLRPDQLRGRGGLESLFGEGGHEGGCGPKGHREGMFMVGGPLQGMGPEFARGIDVMVANTGIYTLGAADLGTLLHGTEAAELMIGVTQVVKQEIVHDGNALTILLRNGDRLVLRVR